jgi:hypothetical protein
MLKSQQRSRNEIITVRTSFRVVATGASFRSQLDGSMPQRLFPRAYEELNSGQHIHKISIYHRLLMYSDTRLGSRITNGMMHLPSNHFWERSI